MKHEELKAIFDHIEFVELDEFIVFSNLEVYNSISGETVKHNTIEELLNTNLHGRSIRDRLEEVHFEYIE